MTTIFDGPDREMKLLALGLPRTGSASIAEALTMLGYKNVFHGLKEIDNFRAWGILKNAADSIFPKSPNYNGRGVFTREEWDELYSKCEVTTYLASIFAPSLIAAYPDAKVLLVIRDFDKWFKSVDELVLTPLCSHISDISIAILDPLLGSNVSISARTQVLGLFNAATAEEARANARETWEQHHRYVRETVPPEQLLEYRMGDGWEPICKFLGKPVPDVEFPWVNESAELKKYIAAEFKRKVFRAMNLALPWIGGILAVGVGSWVFLRKDRM